MCESLTETFFFLSQIALCGEDSHEQGLVLQGTLAGLGPERVWDVYCTHVLLQEWGTDVSLVPGALVTGRVYPAVLIIVDALGAGGGPSHWIREGAELMLQMPPGLQPCHLPSNTRGWRWPCDEAVLQPS